MAAWKALAAALLLLPCSAVTPQELASWFGSSAGLAMSSSDAAALAQHEWGTLTQCGVTVPTLQALRDAMMDTKNMDLGIIRTRSELLPLVKQHVSPAKLGTLYDLLSSSYTLFGGLGFPKGVAQTDALTMIRQSAEPDVLKALYQVCYGYNGLGFDQNTARQTALNGATAGADSQMFRDAYNDARGKGASQQSAIDTAFRWSVVNYLDGLAKRYAQDGADYSAKEFQDYYPTTWFGEWLAAPLEKRVSTDRLAYTASQFSRHFGSSWESAWASSPFATQVRLADDSKPYTMREYQQYYGTAWQAQWSRSPELACKECAPYSVEAALTSAAAADLVA